MCLRINKKFNSEKEIFDFFKKPLIAKEEIKVYKVLEKSFNKPYTYDAPYQRHFKYEKGFQYIESKLTQKIIEGDLYIFKGFHARVDLDTAMSKKNGLTAVNRVIIEMYIPKGSKYFLGSKGDIVSNNLIWY